MLELLTELITKWPWVHYVLIAVGVMRVVFKPLFSLLQAAALATPSPKDDSFLAAVMDSKIYKAVAYALDYLGSIKLPSVKK
jgi:hypothetical protein